jgi:glutamate-ammonia-ligase adenylyltransferase
VLLGWFADAAEPDAGLLAFRQVSEALGETPWFLRLLRDETKAAERMAACWPPAGTRPACCCARRTRSRSSPTTPSSSPSARAAAALRPR